MKHFQPLIFEMSHCICNQPLDFMGIHLFCYIHGGEITILHNVVQDVFTIMLRDARFCLLKVNSCLLAPCPTIFMFELTL